MGKSPVCTEQRSNERGRTEKSEEEKEQLFRRSGICPNNSIICHYTLHIFAVQNKCTKPISRIKGNQASHCKGATSFISMCDVCAGWRLESQPTVRAARGHGEAPDTQSRT